MRLFHPIAIPLRGGSTLPTGPGNHGPVPDRTAQWDADTLSDSDGSESSEVRPEPGPDNCSTACISRAGHEAGRAPRIPRVYGATPNHFNN